MKTLKITELTHKNLLKIKAYFGYKTLDETIDMCIGEFLKNCYPGDPKEIYEYPKEIYKFDDK